MTPVHNYRPSDRRKSLVARSQLLQSHERTITDHRQPADISAASSPSAFCPQLKHWAVIALPSSVSRSAKSSLGACAERQACCGQLVCRPEPRQRWRRGAWETWFSSLLHEIRASTAGGWRAAWESRHLAVIAQTPKRSRARMTRLWVCRALLVVVSMPVVGMFTSGAELGGMKLCGRRRDRPPGRLAVGAAARKSVRLVDMDGVH